MTRTWQGNPAARIGFALPVFRNIERMGIVLFVTQSDMMTMKRNNLVRSLVMDRLLLRVEMTLINQPFDPVAKRCCQCSVLHFGQLERNLPLIWTRTN